ncbi:MAG: GerAB/ArcD/ProY family transporter [Clostridiaceae bacterium]|nr:GerAB/ArcD/ProY family transporter [Clostridiaceae bacterium]
MDLFDISEVLGGKVLKNILGIIFIVYILLSSSIFLRNFCECLQIVYYPSTNIIFVILFFIIAICIVNHLQFNASLKANLIFVPFVLISIIFLFCANLRYFTPQRIFPILGNGLFDTFILGIGNIYALNGVVFIYFLPPLLKEPEKLKKIAISSVCISSAYLILSVSIILFMFPFFTGIDEIIPLYTAATYVEFGSFFQRLESIFLLIWIIAFSCYLSIVNKFAMLLFKKITNIKHSKPLIFPFAIIILAISLIPKNYAISKFYEVHIYRYFMIGVVFVLGIVVLALSYFKEKKKKVIKNE